MFCPKEAKEGRKGLKGAFSWDCSGNVAAVGRALVQEADLDIATSALFHTAGLELIFYGGQFRSSILLNEVVNFSYNIYRKYACQKNGSNPTVKVCDVPNLGSVDMRPIPTASKLIMVKEHKKGKYFFGQSEDEPILKNYMTTAKCQPRVH